MDVFVGSEVEAADVNVDRVVENVTRQLLRGAPGQKKKVKDQGKSTHGTQTARMDGWRGVVLRRREHHVPSRGLGKEASTKKTRACWGVSGAFTSLHAPYLVKKKKNACMLLLRQRTHSRQRQAPAPPLKAKNNIFSHRSRNTQDKMHKTRSKTPPKRKRGKKEDKTLSVNHHCSYIMAL